MTEMEKEFVRGYACAAAFVARWEPTCAQEIISEGGFKKKDLIAAECEQADIDSIYKKPQEANHE